MREPCDQAEVVAGDVDQVALVQVLPAAQPGPAHAAAVENEGEAPLDHLGAQLERHPGHAGQQTGAVVDHRAAGSVVAMPAQEAVALRLGDARLPRPVVERLQRLPRVVPLVGHHLGRHLGARGRLDRGEVARGALQRARQAGGVAPVGGVHLGRDHRAGVEVHRVLGLVGQTRAAVLQLGDPRVRIGRALPLRVGQPLALAPAIQPDQVPGRRRLDAARLGHAGQHLTVALAGVAPHDRPHRRVRLHRRGVDADPLALDETTLGQPPQHPGECRVVHLERQPGAGAAQPGVVRHRLALAEAQELAQGQAVGAAPLQPALAVDALEVADQQHAEVAPRRQRGPAPVRGVVGRTLSLDEAVEPRGDELDLQPVVEDVARRAGHLRPGHQHLRLAIPLPTQSHPNPAVVIHKRRNQTGPISSTGC
jgi:hypothetical protein